MHTYAIDKEIRKSCYTVMVLVSLALSAWANQLIVKLGVNLIVGFSLDFGVVYGIIFFIFNNWLWKYLTSIPNLEGKWTASGLSSYQTNQDGSPNFKFEMQLVIKQTFTRIEIYAETSESTSRSAIAGFELDHAVPIFRYVFQNTPLNRANTELQSHPGLIEVRISSKNEMVGDYFSGKHRLGFGELKIKRG